MKVLVTGFQPFGGEKVNPAWQAVSLLPEAIAGAEVVRVEIPVVFGKDAAAVEAAIDAEQPDLVLCVGQAGGRTHLCPEFVGINYMNARIPDNEGNQPVAQRIAPDGPDAYFAMLPVQAMAAACVAEGIPAAVSYTAGTYCCNEVMYALLHCLATKHPGVRGGFVHVPYATGQASALSATTPSMSLDVMARGLELMIACAVEHVGEDVASAASGTEQ